MVRKYSDKDRATKKKRASGDSLADGTPTHHRCVPDPTSRTMHEVKGRLINTRRMDACALLVLIVFVWLEPASPTSTKKAQVYILYVLYD